MIFEQTPVATPEHSVGLNHILRLKLVNSILGAVLLFAGLIYEAFFPEQYQVSQIILALAAVVVALPVFYNGLRGLLDKKGGFMTEQLVSLAILASMIEKNFAVAAIVPIILVFGHLLEEKSIMGVEEAIASLRKLHSRQARVVRERCEVLVDPETLQIGDVVICYPGEVIPADGVVCEGDSLVNQAHITGESIPIEAYTGVGVYAGTINLSGKITIKVNRVSSETLFSKIVILLKEAEQSKAPIVKIVEKYLDLYFPFVIMVAAITLFLSSDVSRAITILVISCPCALILASPTAMISALVTASRLGIMIKNTAFLESLAEVDTLIFDKTGTVTYGCLELQELRPVSDCSADRLLEVAAFCASGSIHPVSASIRSFAHGKGVKPEVPGRQQELHGCGVLAESAGHKYFLGKPDWINRETGIALPSDQSANGHISVWVADEKSFLGQIVFSDKTRPEMHEAIAKCRKLGVEEVYLLTGDKKEIGEQVGSILAADGVICECLPQDKFDFVNSKKLAGRKVMFVGDGINDALALKASDVGVAIARGGSDIAIQNSDITLNSESLLNLPQMFSLSGKTRSIINQNIIIGTGFSLLMMAIAAAGFISPVTGAITHNLGSVFVVLNSSRMLKED